MRIISGTARGTKLNTLNGENTRPTLDRVKESLFNILQNRLQGAVVIDLFAGSGALALESLSRGAAQAILCDNHPEAISIIKKNIEKTHCKEKTKVIYKDYKQALTHITQKADIIFVDPPYQKNIAVDAIKRIVEKNLLTEEGIIVLETDKLERDQAQLEKITNIKIKDLRKYGRVKLIFLNRKG